MLLYLYIVCLKKKSLANLHKPSHMSKCNAVDQQLVAFGLSGLPAGPCAESHGQFSGLYRRAGIWGSTDQRAHHMNISSGMCHPTFSKHLI